jgi:hypothetical protein
VAKNIENRVDDSFKSDDKDSLKFYLSSLAVAWKERADGIRRSSILAIILMAVFELLLRGTLKQVALGPFVFSNVTIVTVFIPTAVAYFYYEAFDNAIAFEDAEEAYAQALKIWNPDAGENELYLTLKPRAPAYWLSEGLGTLAPGARVQSIGNSIIGLVAILGPLCFEGFAFYQLFGVLHAGNALLWINATLSCMLLVIAIWQWLAWSS